MARPREGAEVKVTYSGKADNRVLKEARKNAEKSGITFSKLLERLMIGYNDGTYRFFTPSKK